MISPPLKFQSLVLLLHIFILANFPGFLKHNSLRSVNLSFMLHGVSIFWLEPYTRGLIFRLRVILPRYKLDRSLLQVHEVWCKTSIYS